MKTANLVASAGFIGASHVRLWLFHFRHVGDLGNIEADANGVATINIVDRMVKLHGPISVNGRSFVVRM